MSGVSDVDRLRSRPNTMDDGINPFEYRDVDCSGRSLATLLVAWVGAAMVASVLLRWKYMWIALTILTLIFLFACGYAACNARRAHERIIATEEARILERQRRNGSIQSVSGAVDNYEEVTDPPAYESYWVTDLPPPYAVVIGAEPLPSPSSSMLRSSDSEPTTSTPRISNPPPYSVAIQSDQNTDTSSRSSQAFCQNGNRSGATSVSTDEPTNSQTERVSRTPVTWDEEIKIVGEQTTINEEENSSNNSQRVLSSGTQYLNSIINCTFGIGQIRRNNVERNPPMTSMITTRDRPGILQLNNEDNGISASRMSSSTL